MKLRWILVHTSPLHFVGIPSKSKIVNTISWHFFQTLSKCLGKCYSASFSCLFLVSSFNLTLKGENRDDENCLGNAMIEGKKDRVTPKAFHENKFCVCLKTQFEIELGAISKFPRKLGALESRHCSLHLTKDIFIFSRGFPTQGKLMILWLCCCRWFFTFWSSVATRLSWFANFESFFLSHKSLQLPSQISLFIICCDSDCERDRNEGWQVEVSGHWNIF